jgi:hypothetical protein
MEKELRRLIREKTYKTKFDLLIDTSTKQEDQTKYVTNAGYKHFCYDAFTKGDLRVVASTTYLTYLLDPNDRDSTYITSDNLLQFSDNRSGLIIRGEELFDTRIKLDLHNKFGKELCFCKDLIHALTFI